MDRAGWNTTGELECPDNITPLFLPRKSPELNLVENIWQHLRQTCLSNRVFDRYEDIIDAACHAWNKLIDKPWKSRRSACANGHTKVKLCNRWHKWA